MTSDRSGGRRCPDCGAIATQAESVHCAICGQRLSVGPLRLGQITKDLLDTLVSLELPILRTTRDLLRAPGPVADAWIAGRRRTYVHPVKFLVIVGLVVALTYEPVQQWRSAWFGPGRPNYSVGLAQHQTQYFAFFCLALLLPIAWTTRGIARLLGIERPWLDWYVLGLFTYGLGVAVQLLLDVLGGLLPAAADGVVRVVETGAPAVLFAWGAFGFVARRWRGLFAAVAAHVLLLGLAVLLSQLLSIGR